MICLETIRAAYKVPELKLVKMVY